MEVFNRFAIALFGYLAEAAPFLVIGYLLIALVREFVPNTILLRHLGGRGVRPVLNALGIGAALPVCSCGELPLAIGLVRSGASYGTAMTLMASAGAVSPVTLILGYTLLGWPILLAYTLTMLIGSIVLGITGNCLLHVEQPSLPVHQPTCAPGDDCCDEQSVATSSGDRSAGRIRRAMRWAFGELGPDVTVDLIVGLSVAAAITALVPREWITSWLGAESAWTLLGIIVVAIPMYTCSAPSLIVVKSLLLMGASPGAAVAFLVAGPATNFGEINGIRGGMSTRAAVHYVVCLVLTALVGGMITNQVLAIGSAAPEVGPATAALEEILGASGWQEAFAHVPGWHYPFVAILAPVLGLGITRRMQSRQQRGSAARESAASKMLEVRAD